MFSYVAGTYPYKLLQANWDFLIGNNIIEIYNKNQFHISPIPKLNESENISGVFSLKTTFFF